MTTALLHNFGQTYYTYTYTTNNGSSSLGPAFWIGYGVGVLVFAAVMLAAGWKLLTKAGRPGWASLVLIYNTLNMIWLAGKPWWWILLMFIPLVNIVVTFMLYGAVSKAFGRGTGTALLLFFLPIIGFPILAFGDAKYQGTKPAA